MLGGRNARRQIRSVLADAAGAGAYSVAFSVARGALLGFTIYFSGDFCGAGARAASAPPTRTTVHVAGRAGDESGDAPAPRAAAVCAAQPSPQGESACSVEKATMPANAPAKAAQARRRGCRAGRRKRRVSSSGVDACACPAPRHVSAPRVEARAPSAAAPSPPSPPSLPASLPLSAAGPSSSSLSALAPVFAPGRKSIEDCGPRAPKAPRRGERYDRKRERYERDRRYLRDRARDVRDRPRYQPRVHVPLGAPWLSIGGMARYEARRNQLYEHGMKVNEYEVSDSEMESGERGSSDG